MQYYFKETKRQEKLEKELLSWLKTPFKHRTCVKQKGADCVNFVAGVLSELGICKMPKIPEYPPDWNLHITRDLLIDGIKTLPLATGLYFDEIDFKNPMIGDLMVFFYGKSASHAAIYFNGYIYQAVTGVGVVKSRYKDPKWFNKKITNFRLMEV